MATDEGVAQGLAGWLGGKTFGSVTVLASKATIATDLEEEPAVFLDLTVSDPAPNTDTWPIEDVLALRRAVLRKASELQLAMRIYVRLSPATDAPQEDDTPALFG